MQEDSLSKEDSRRRSRKPARPAPQSGTAKRGRRPDADRRTGRWRLSIREVEERSGKYRWKTFLVQGWKDEKGRWARRKFRDRQQAEAFMAVKRLEVETRGDVLRPIVTRLTQAEARDAEAALDCLKSLSAAAAGPSAVPSLLEAAQHFADYWRARVAVESVPFRDARRAIVAELARPGGNRSALDYDGRLQAFERWLVMLPRYTAQSIEPHWTPPVFEVTGEDVAAYLASLRTRGGMVAGAKTRHNVRANLHGFFEWCRGLRRGRPIPGVARRWCLENPVSHISRPELSETSPQILSIESARFLMTHVETARGGELALYFALAAFAGIRPGLAGEIAKLSRHPGLWTPCPEAGGRPLIDLERSVLTIPADVAKTGRRRIVTIQKNLGAWLTRYWGKPVFPAGCSGELRRVRKACRLAHDVCRHSFISYHVGLTGSKARTALQAGNSEGVIDRHYLHIPSEKEARLFFGIMPAPAPRKKRR